MKFTRLLLILSLSLMLFGCGQAGPQAGSPEWLWAAARDSYNAGDYEKACEHLRKIEKAGSNPFVDRARAWRLLMEAGAANAQLELAKAYAEGSTQTRTEKTAFQRAKNEHLNEAKRHAFELFEGFGDFNKSVPDKVVLEFPFPQGTAGEVPELDRVYKGLSVTEDIQLTADAKMMKRGVVRMVDKSLAQEEEDSAAAQSALKAGKAEVPSARFMLSMAVALNRSATIFDKKNLFETDKMKLFEGKSLEAAKRVLELKPDPETEKEAKKLIADIEKGIKDRGKKGRA